MADSDRLSVQDTVGSCGGAGVSPSGRTWPESAEAAAGLLRGAGFTVGKPFDVRGDAGVILGVEALDVHAVEDGAPVNIWRVGSERFAATERREPTIVGHGAAAPDISADRPARLQRTRDRPSAVPAVPACAIEPAVEPRGQAESRSTR